MDDLFEVERFSHVMNICDMEEFKYFDGRGNLTAAGKKQFWIGINNQIKASEYQKIDLQPSTKSTVKPTRVHQSKSNSMNYAFSHSPRCHSSSKLDNDDRKHNHRTSSHKSSRKSRSHHTHSRHSPSNHR